jgi:hypothetical protein
MLCPEGIKFENALTKAHADRTAVINAYTEAVNSKATNIPQLVSLETQAQKAYKHAVNALSKHKLTCGVCMAGK